MTKKSISTNAIATTFVEQAYKLHCKIYHHFYPYPLQIKFENHQLSLQVDNIFQLKYTPWIVSIVLITTLIGFNSCIFVLSLAFFYGNSKISVSVIVFLIMLTSCSILEWATYLVYSKATEIKFLLNQLFLLERTCKFKKSN